MAPHAGNLAYDAKIMFDAFSYPLYSKIMLA